MQLETFQWHSSNMTEGCTASCEADINRWVSNVRLRCTGDEMKEMGNIIRPWSLPLIYQHKYQLGCMRGSASEWCWLESLKWQGSEIRQYDQDLCATGDPEFDADVCFEEGFNQYAIEADDVRLSNLYEKDLDSFGLLTIFLQLCSDCFLKIFHHRLLAPVLEKSEFTDYLVEQHGELETFCSTAMPLTTSSQDLFLRTMPIPTPTTTDSAPPVMTTCAGQLIEPNPTQLWCDKLSENYNVPTGDLIVLTGDWACGMTKAICAPPACPLKHVGFEQQWTCESLRALISTAENNVTAVEFASWNKRIVGTCDNVRGDQYICTGPPGGKYEFPPPVHAPTSASYYTTATPALPTHAGTTDGCGKYHDVRAGDTCYGIALRECRISCHWVCSLRLDELTDPRSITLEDFLELNPQIWTNCTNLWLDYSYCVAPVLVPPTTSMPSAVDPDLATVAHTMGDVSVGSVVSQVTLLIETSNPGGSGEGFCDADNCYSGGGSMQKL
ncbi:lysM domain-containing protein ARB_01155/01156 [Colletotrichum liriopes]|uniref:LysM domain-containing protein ARB_01155/01156 n=1 Tax=Colletotrichum liriopes TaxID=708192 RepID=A0AA37H0A9_9PEZI|nr:lysM domain-containing protein ARB_01155/01156 [Colletotrichum liriopes]